MSKFGCLLANFGRVFIHLSRTFLPFWGMNSKTYCICSPQLNIYLIYLLHGCYPFRNLVVNMLGLAVV
jgi:hypothetical protein